MAIAWMSNDAKTLSHELLAIFDANEISDRFREFCPKNGVLTPSDLAASCTDDKDLKAEIFDATGFTDIGFQEKKNIRKAWYATRALMTTAASSSSAAPSPQQPKKMPEGAELRLRTVWKQSHGISLSGVGL